MISKYGAYFLILICGHILGDFVFQNSWQAMNKKKIWLATWGHGAAYATGITLIFILSGLVLSFSPDKILWGGVIIMALITPMHSLTDRYYNGSKVIDASLHIIQNSIVLAPIIWC